MSGTITSALQSTQTTTVVAVATTGTGLGTILDLIPDDIGKLATVIGILLSLVLIYVHVQTLKKISMENTLLRKKLLEEIPDYDS